MNSRSLLKVYGHIYPADTTMYAALETACASALADADDVPLLERDGDMVRISFEGTYFPLEDVLAVVEERLRPEHKGKLDVLDMEGWQLIRHTFENGRIVRRSASLNHVLDYSGH